MTRGGPPRPTRYLWHALAAAWIALVLVVSWVRHRDLPELRTAAREGAVAGRVEAIAQLAMRADPASLADEYVDTLLESDEPLLRELAFTNLFTRNPAIRIARRDLLRLSDRQERFRASLWFRCRMTTNERVLLADLDRWFAATAGGAAE